MDNNNSSVRKENKIETNNNKNHKNKKKYKHKPYRRRSSNKFKKKNQIIKIITGERIQYLMERAIEIYSADSELANRYVEISRKYSMAAKIRIPPKFKKLICHKCKNLMLPDVSSKIIIEPCSNNGSIKQITCLNCGKTSKFYSKIETIDHS